MLSNLTEKPQFGVAWYCARTHPKHEHIAAGGLRRRMGLEVFNPSLRMERATRRGVVNVIEPLFPCYVFVRCNLEEKLDAIRYVTGISNLVHFGKRIPSVADEVIDELRQCFESDEPMAVENQFRPGTEVTVAEGPLLGSRAVVVNVLPARQRVQVLLDFLGRTTVAEMEGKCLAVEDRRMADLMPALASGPKMSVAVAA